MPLIRCRHPSLFHTATSLLIWYEMFWMRDISNRLTWVKFINMLSVYVQSGTHRPFNFKIQDSRFKSIYSTMYRHQSYKTMEQCEKTNQNISWWVHVWRPSLRPYGRYHKGHQKMFGSTGRIKVSRYDSNNNKKRRLMPKGINAVTMPSGE